jgi:hypothetical protein
MGAAVSSHGRGSTDGWVLGRTCMHVHVVCLLLAEGGRQADKWAHESAWYMHGLGVKGHGLEMVIDGLRYWLMQQLGEG